LNLDHYSTLGSSGLRVSPLCLGTMTFGEDWGWGCDIKTSTQILDAYTDRGGNFIDTANIYTKGHSEKIIGDHVGRFPLKRNRLVIATKFMGNLYPGDPNGGGAGRKSLIAACEQSLRRLQMDYIDLYWIHFWDPFTPIDETMRALDDLVQSGKVRYLGVSDIPAWKVAQAQTIAQFRGWSPLVALQIEYSLLQRTVEGELIPAAEALGLGVMPWSPLKGGVLTGTYTRENISSIQPSRGDAVKMTLDEKAFAILDILDSIAKESSRTIAQIALAWLQHRPGVSCSIIGARTCQQLEHNLDSLEIQLSNQDTTRLNEASEPTLNFPHQFLQYAVNIASGGSTINGQPSIPWKLAPTSDKQRH